MKSAAESRRCLASAWPCLRAVELDPDRPPVRPDQQRGAGGQQEQREGAGDAGAAYLRRLRRASPRRNRRGSTSTRVNGQNAPLTVAFATDSSGNEPLSSRDEVAPG